MLNYEIIISIFLKIKSNINDYSLIGIKYIKKKILQCMLLNASILERIGNVKLIHFIFILLINENLTALVYTL